MGRICWHFLEVWGGRSQIADWNAVEDLHPNKPAKLHCISAPQRRCYQWSTCSNEDLPPSIPSLCLEGLPPSHKAFLNPTGDTFSSHKGDSWTLAGLMALGERMGSRKFCPVLPLSRYLEKVLGIWGSWRFMASPHPSAESTPSLSSYFEITLSSSQLKVTCK